ncbi:MAG: CPBP family intramembrane metalloprotease [Bacteroidia bacterium]|nr:CPBP family intramembrane metalloprotease [Bacteroidia bacterium]
MTSKKANRISRFVYVLALSIILVPLGIYSPIKIHFTWRGVLIGFCVGVVVYLVNIIITTTILCLCFGQRSINNQSKQIIAATDDMYWTTIVFSPIFEELVFRSFLFYHSCFFLEKSIAVIINFIIFALLHFNDRFIELCIMGLAFLSITIYYDNLLPAIIAHVTNNFFAVANIRRKFFYNNADKYF